ncbi:flavoprotein [Pilimelia anulata]|uniref:Flavoprotein n=1 Tax=Pilimelia anulata TaxID=53371 RepID=A0A8J3F888_9ACTN|nr:flavoprotein [Pilimelia anulata]GGJ84347.1 flavoprotein [Pilimelia anulata]
MSPPLTLYALVCAALPAGDVGVLVDHAARTGWRTCVVTTPQARDFVDVPELEKRTGYPVRSSYKHPAEDDVHPPPDALVLAPATFNTINKWRVGITDTLVLGLLTEQLGLGRPVIAAPFTNRAMATHPAYGESLALLAEWGVTVVQEEGSLANPGAADPAGFPWAGVCAALDRVRAQTAHTVPAW